jgi:hypothetical protein
MLWNGNECGKKKNEGNEKLKGTIRITNYDGSETGKCGILELLGLHDNK